MRRSFSQSPLHKREGITMTSEHNTRGFATTNRARLLAAIGTETETEILRMSLKSWDARRTSMRENLTGDRRQ